MSDKELDPVIQRVMAEQSQGHPTRQHLFEDLEELLKRPVITFFTSFSYPVTLEDEDVDMLAGLLQMMDLSNGLVLMISSPGGNGLAAERLINVCRSFSGTDEYWAIVPGKAKSAATLACFGASKIMMGPTSELGPVDPQIAISDDDVLRRVSVYNIVKSYRDLFDGAVKEDGNLEPYLQQLAYFDARIIKEFEGAIELSKDISKRALATGMMDDLSEDDIEKKISIFLSPEHTKTHGRPIYRDEAADCGLNVDTIDGRTKVWQLIYELYVRTNDFVSSRVSKCIESREHSFTVPVPRG